MYILQVEQYKNAVRVITFLNGKVISEIIIKLRWWQRRQARRIINDFYLDNETELDNKQVDWLSFNYEYLTWDFETRTIRVM